MKYFTKEWYDLMQKLDYTLCMKAVEDKAYTDEEISAMYDKNLKAAIRRDRTDYDRPPQFLHFEPDEIDPKDFAVFDPASGVLVKPTSKEEVLAQLEEERRIANEEFENRPPFDPTLTEEIFRQVYEGGLKHGYSRFPDWVRDEVDIRLIALGCLPRSVFNKLKAEQKHNKALFEKINRTAHKALGEAVKNIPETISSNFGFHDGEVTSLTVGEGNAVMLITEDCIPYEGETPYTRVTFEGAEITERDKNLKFPTTWLYEELYKTDSGYEAHMMFTGEGLRYLTVRCRNIKIERSVDCNGIYK